MHASHASRRRPNAANAAAVLLTYAARLGSTALALRYLPQRKGQIWARAKNAG
jgi:hypothetical protein